MKNYNMTKGLITLYQIREVWYNGSSKQNRNRGQK